MNPKVCVVVLCYNGVELTLECIKSLRSQTYSNLDIIIIDNDSPDNTADIVQEHCPDLFVLNTGENLGYVAGNNLGIRMAIDEQADILFLVNNDTRLDQECVKNLVCTLNNDRSIGVVGPMVYTWEDSPKISSAGGLINWKYADAINIGAGEDNLGQYPARSVDFINGCGIMVTRQAVERAGVLDPKFFMYWEETDWCQRIKKCGFKIWFEPSAVMWHKAPIHWGELSATTIYYMTRNRLLFFYRHAPGWMKPVSLARALHGAVRGYQRHRLNGRLAHAAATRLAILHALQNRWGWTDPTLWNDGYSKG